jgi:hypothetical protein
VTASPCGLPLSLGATATRHGTGASQPTSNPKRTIADLEQRAGIHRDGTDHLIHEFAEWQQVEKVKAVSDKRAAAGKKGAKSRWGNDDKPDGKCHTNRDGRQTDNRQPTSLGYISRQTDDSTTPDPSSVIVDQVLDIAARATWIMNKTTATGSPGRYIAGIRRNMSAERRPEIALAIHAGKDPIDCAAVLVGQGSPCRVAATELGIEWE